MCYTPVTHVCNTVCNTRVYRPPIHTCVTHVCNTRVYRSAHTHVCNTVCNTRVYRPHVPATHTRRRAPRWREGAAQVRVGRLAPLAPRARVWVAQATRGRDATRAPCSAHEVRPCLAPRDTRSPGRPSGGRGARRAKVSESRSWRRVRHRCLVTHTHATTHQQGIRSTTKEPHQCKWCLSVGQAPHLRRKVPPRRRLARMGEQSTPLNGASGSSPRSVSRDTTMS